MTYIQRELDRLERALDAGVGNPRYYEIYAARQALAWAVDPGAARSPYGYLMNTFSGSKDCLAGSCRSPSSDTQRHLDDAPQPPTHSYPERASSIGECRS